MKGKGRFRLTSVREYNISDLEAFANAYNRNDSKSREYHLAINHVLHSLDSIIEGLRQADKKTSLRTKSIVKSTFINRASKHECNIIMMANDVIRKEQVVVYKNLENNEYCVTTIAEFNALFISKLLLT